jgi:hypothetical protein
MSFLNVVSVLSFRKYNPDWKIIIYNATQTPDDSKNRLQYVPYTGKDYFYILGELPYVEIRELDITKYRVHSILVSDIWRREILYETGGVYSDFDVLWLKPMKEFKYIDCIGDSRDFEAVVSFYEYTKGFHNVSNLIAEKGSPFMQSMIEETARVRHPFGDQAFGTKMVNKMYPDLKSITDKFPRVLAIKYETFYPYSTFRMDQLFVENDLAPIQSKNVMCIHWFYANSYSKAYINGETKDCSMTTILKKEGYL